MVLQSNRTKRKEVKAMRQTLLRLLKDESGQLTGQMGKGPMGGWEVALLILAILGVGALIGCGFLARALPG
jgi:hypothetical protein